MISLAESEGSRDGTGSVIKSKNEGTGKIRSIEGAGGVTEMVVEARKAAPGEKLAEMGKHCFAARVFGGRPLRGCAANGKSDRIDVRETQATRGQDLAEREVRERVDFVAACEFFFLDRRDNAVIIEESRGSVRTGCGDAQDVHCAHALYVVHAKEEAKSPSRCTSTSRSGSGGHKTVTNWFAGNWPARRSFR